MKMLIVEDSEEYQEILTRTFGDHDVQCVSSAEEATLALVDGDYDVILVDINLPRKDGYSLITEIQANPEMTDVTVMCLTGRKETTDKVTAFSLGADDYITKPFDPIELRARVEAKLKKSARRKQKEMKTVVGNIEIDHVRHRVSVQETDRQREIIVTQTEFKLLSCLARRPEQVYTRDQLLVTAWGDDARVLDRVVDAYVCTLRKKLGTTSHKIKAVTGVGYKLTAIAHKAKAS